MGKLHHHSRTQKPAKLVALKKSVKVKYISSPVTVTVHSASEFRAIVQELTGKDSDIALFHDDMVAAATGDKNRAPAQSGPSWQRAAEHDPLSSMPYNGFLDDGSLLWREYSEGIAGLHSQCVFA